MAWVKYTTDVWVAVDNDDPDNITVESVHVDDEGLQLHEVYGDDMGTPLPHADRVRILDAVDGPNIEPWPVWEFGF